MGGAAGQVCAGTSSAPCRALGKGVLGRRSGVGGPGHSGKAGEGEGEMVDTGRPAGQRGGEAGTLGWFQRVHEARLPGWPPASY